MPRRLASVALLCLTAGAAGAQGTAPTAAPSPAASAPAPAPMPWLTLMGDVRDADAETVQIEPESVVVFNTLRTMRIRVSRNHERMSYDNRPYRAYMASVQIDCSDLSARFRQLQMFRGPLWTGASRVLNYTEADMPPMQFRDMQPNPTQRIVQAACSIDRVQTR